jgi:hypothetical protein
MRSQNSVSVTVAESQSGTADVVLEHQRQWLGTKRELIGMSEVTLNATRVPQESGKKPYRVLGSVANSTSTNSDAWISLLVTRSIPCFQAVISIVR